MLISAPMVEILPLLFSEASGGGPTVFCQSGLLRLLHTTNIYLASSESSGIFNIYLKCPSGSQIDSKALFFLGCVDTPVGHPIALGDALGPFTGRSRYAHLPRWRNLVLRVPPIEASMSDNLLGSVLLSEGYGFI